MLFRPTSLNGAAQDLDIHQFKQVVVEQRVVTTGLPAKNYWWSANSGPNGCV